MLTINTSNNSHMFTSTDEVWYAIENLEAPRHIRNAIAASLMLCCPVPFSKGELSVEIQEAPVRWCDGMFLGWAPGIKLEAWARILAYDWNRPSYVRDPKHCPAFSSILKCVYGGRLVKTELALERLVAASLVADGIGREKLVESLYRDKLRGVAQALLQGPLVPEACLPEVVKDSNVMRWVEAGLLEQTDRYRDLTPDIVNSIAAFEIKRKFLKDKERPASWLDLTKKTVEYKSEEVFAPIEYYSDTSESDSLIESEDESGNKVQDGSTEQELEDNDISIKQESSDDCMSKKEKVKIVSERLC